MFGLGKLKAVSNRLMNAAVIITLNVDTLNPSQVLPAVAFAGCCIAAAKVCGARNAKRRSHKDNDKQAVVSYRYLSIHLPGRYCVTLSQLHLLCKNKYAPAKRY